jgi:hypothetical protein
MHPRNDQSKYAQERKLPVFPTRGSTDAKPTPTRPVLPSAKAIEPVRTPRNSTSERVDFGFDDIPTDDENMKDIRFRDILSAWIKQGTKHSPLEKHHLRLSKFIKDRNLTSWKDDIKWALQADLDEPVKPRPKTTPQLSKKPGLPIAAHPKPTAHPQQAGKTIDININLGSLPKLPKLPRFSAIRSKLVRVHPSRKTIVIGAVLSTVFVGLFFSYSYLTRTHNTVLADISGGTASDGKRAPNYATVLPTGKKIEDLGGWSRVSPPDRNPVFAYTDTIDQSPINVSQQPLPDSFKSDTTGKISELAKGYAATDKETAGGTDFYVGTSIKGPQSVILTKNNLLILIKSTSKLTTDQWTKYISSLQ